jgi:hypothetical protein
VGKQKGGGRKKKPASKSAESAEKADSSLQANLSRQATTAPKQALPCTPRVKISPNPEIVLKGETATLTAQGENPEGGAYAWTYHPDGVADTAQGPTVQVTLQNSGTVQVSVDYTADKAPVSDAGNVYFLDVTINDEEQPLKDPKFSVGLFPAESEERESGPVPAVGLPALGKKAAYQWTVVDRGPTDITADEDSRAEGEFSASKPGVAKVEVSYSHKDKPDVRARAGAQMIFYRIEPAIIPKLFKSGESAQFKVLGTPDKKLHTWTAGEEEIRKTTDDGDPREHTVVAQEPGVVYLSAVYNPRGVQAIGASVAAAVFIQAQITHKTIQLEARKKTDRPAYRKFKVLLGLPRDPETWKTGEILLESSGIPEEVTLEGLENKAGEHEWMPQGSFIRVVKKQPDDEHGPNLPKVLLRALPGSGGGPAAGGALEKVIKEYRLCGLTAPDEVEVTVTRFACSQVKWQRRGKDLTGEDTIVECTHHDTGNSTCPDSSRENPSDLGGALTPRGHHHGGWCSFCSGWKSGGASTAPRDVWHYVETPQDVIDETRRLSDLLRTFARADSYSNVTGEPNLFTEAAYNGLRKIKGNGKMFGVLRGANSSGREVELYALSGDKDFGGAWCKKLPLDKGTFTRYSDGNIDTYAETADPLAIGVTTPFKQLGKCAAAKLLERARFLKLSDIKVAEVWLKLKERGDVAHNTEVGSCEQCRRFLGRVLCEKGPK